MSRWEAEQIIDARIVDGELMLSASDVAAWIRESATHLRPRCYGPAAIALADSFDGMCFDATLPYVDGSGS